jgi:S-methylmethionine-dependent homocysteine/selenocysteine methylase
MHFHIIEELHHPDRGRIALWLNFEKDQSRFMVAGGDIITVERYSLEITHLNPRHSPGRAAELEQMQGELTYLNYIDAGAFGYVRQNEGQPEREQRKQRLKLFIHETEVELIRMREIGWLTEAGAIFDAEKDIQKKEAWLNAARNEQKPLPGVQGSLFS